MAILGSFWHFATTTHCFFAFGKKGPGLLYMGDKTGASSAGIPGIMRVTPSAGGEHVFPNKNS